MKFTLIAISAFWAVAGSGFAFADVPGVEPPHAFLADVPGVEPPHAFLADVPGVEPPHVS